MIIPVEKDTEKKWAELCASLWIENSVDGLLLERAKGRLPNEFLYLADGEAVAFISLSLRHDYVEGTDTSPVGYIEGIYVKPEFRNKGIAKNLVGFAKKWALRNGCSELASDCELSNADSRIFHNKIGFEEAGSIVCFKMSLRD